ncbi:MAG TPA: tRNA lysidine(34) synthetase TilS [Bryobacteraceae bacterium]|nr:tRNA lysidine(34) synthetase TilS [Bryobacteraceae bacterium]
MTSTSLPAAILATIRRYNMLRAGDRIGIAVSAGLDSMALLRALVELQPQLPVELAVVHYNHRLRGEESEEDLRFVSAAAASLGLTLFCASAASVPVSDIEQTARNDRYAYFNELIASSHVTAVATAHTRSDQAETVLGRILRGSGVAGMAGIRPATRERIIRPLLDSTRTEVEEYASLRGLQWREDSSNADPRFLRNRIRRELLPLACEIAGDAVPGVLANTAAAARDEEDYWDRTIGQVFAGSVLRERGHFLVSVTVLRDLHPAVARRLIRRCLLELRGDLRRVDLRHTDAILDLAQKTEGHGRVLVPGADAMRSFDLIRIAVPEPGGRFARSWCHLLPPDQIFPIRLPAGPAASIWMEMRSLHASEMSPDSYNKDLDEIDYARLPRPLEWRNWQPGDTFEVPGRGSQRVKTLFQEGRVPLWERSTWPVLASGSVVIWTRRWGTAGPFLAGPNTRERLRLMESRCEPGGPNESELPGRASKEIDTDPFQSRKTETGSNREIE